MSWLPTRDKLDPIQASAVDFVVAQEGNFYIKGEAGTGKSVVLAHIAAKYKADNPESRVAALTYTNAFAACLNEGLKETGVEVQTILRFKPQKGYVYDLIVIDEAQDIRIEWVNRLRRMSRKFVFAGDFSQMIFGETIRVITEEELISKFDITQKPIDLKKDYRVPMNQRILLARVYQNGRRFFSEVVNKAQGERVTLYHAENWEDEMSAVDGYVMGKVRRRRPSAVLFNTNHKVRLFLETVVPGTRKRFEGVYDTEFLKNINEFLQAEHSRYRYLGKGFGNLLESNAEPLVYVMTWHGSKGLDFETVAIPNLGAKGASVKANTFYVAMTRSRKNLMLSYCGAAGPQTQSARISGVVEFFSRAKNDFEQPSLL